MLDQALHNRIEIDLRETSCPFKIWVLRCGLLGSWFGFIVFSGVLVCFVVRFRFFGALFMVAT